MGILEKAGEKAKKAALIAAGTTYIAGSKLKNEAGLLYDKAVEDWQMKKEIENINEYCKKTREQFQNDINGIETDLQKEKDQFTYILNQIIYRLPTYKAIVSYMEQWQDNITYDSVVTFKDIPFVVGKDIETGTASSLKAAGATGIATGLGTVGLVTVFGSASTGTALSALTGSAYIHATLAALGGGSLATGGFGMIGGAIALGTAFLAPAAVVGGYLLNKQVRKAYDEAVSRKAEAVEFKKEQLIFFQKLYKGIQSFRRLNYEFYAFSRFFDELLNMSIPAFAIGINNSYKKLVKKSIEIVNCFTNIPVITKNEWINVNLDNDIQKVVVQVSECKNWLRMLMRSLGVEEAEAMNKARYQEVDVETTDEIVILVKRLRKENGWKDVTIKNQEIKINIQADRINEQENELKKKNDYIIGLTEELKNLQLYLTEEQGKQEQSEQIIEKLCVQAVGENPEKYKIYESRLSQKYIHLNSQALQFIATGEMLHDLFCKKEFEGVDFSSVVIEYGNGVEDLLKKALLKMKIPIAMRNGSKFPPIGEIIQNCVYAKKYRHNFEDGFYELLDEFNRKCRVTAAHGRGVDKQLMENARKYLFYGNNEFAKGLLSYFDEMFGCWG